MTTPVIVRSAAHSTRSQRHRSRVPRTAVIMGSLAAVLIVLAGCGGDVEESGEHAGDVHEHYSSAPGLIDRDEPAGVLTAALAAIYSWEPVTDTSPTDGLRRAAPFLTGDALASAQSPPASGVRVSADWAAWRSSGDLITARVDEPRISRIGPTTVLGQARVVQTVLAIDGASTPLDTFTATTRLKLTDGHWKVATYPSITH
ncbi:hypothetical protein Gbro_4939 (plasmid) [Gordonia bronchialis DSM 43247]|uniref:Uncharacterized protein n=1 Tax=Gordonia bronchialis (strain ATCC 25592 / DSM 43247 / BCRC 13721 / JCM 3198 / KCTC 3076 / NBRC 16047 / NCTC 10667) TaxID=526226 RepID=D0LFK3_GORB4|nr:hypothetical protein [Gordonia bronchialis]ACY24052.1 hypothetical protein Gbro_4939 [Gordonia bronchialis DSM 43247]MCC3326057.1 hypothetical protein [Gordonia bronchialis]QGS27369.1 hypothetical protein FOB84_24630 [Gordonia bronchialis]STS10786.1 Uncharacterised protein [Gordonia bronchialis]